MSEKTERFQFEIFDREELHLNHVSHIVRFDEESVTLMTSHGKILIEGKDLVIENLNHESGNILIKGMIHSVFFSKKETIKTKVAFQK